MTSETAKIIRIAALGMTAVLAILLVIFLASHKFVTFDVVNPDSIDDTHLTLRGKDNTTIGNLFGLYVVPRSQPIMKISLPAGEETILSTQPLQFLAFGTKVELRKLKQADIYTSKSLGCNTYDQATDTILTRRCSTAASSLYTLDDSSTKPWGNTESQQLPLGLFFYNYLNGVMTLTTADASERHALAYNASGMHYYELKDKASTRLDTDLAVDMTDYTNASFAVYSASSGDVAYYTIRDQKVTSVKQYSTAKDATKDSEVRSRCTTAGETVFCLRGSLSSPFGHQDETATKQPSVITEIDFSQETPRAKTYEIKTDLPYINDIYTDKSKAVYVKNNLDLYRIDNHRPIMVYPGVAEVASGEKLVFTTNDHVYRLDSPTDARKIFSKSGLVIANLSSYGSTLLFDIHSENDRLLSDTLTFRIQETPSDGASILSLLPLSGKNLPIMNAVFSKNKLQLQPETFYTSDRATGVLTYDKDEYNRSKATILSYFDNLKSEGKLPQNFELLFTE